MPIPTMSVDRFAFPEGDLLVCEVQPSPMTPVRYRGRVFVRIGPRRDIASEDEERILTERRTANMATFDVTPCLRARLSDLNVDMIRNGYLPKAVDADVLASDSRSLEEQMASVGLYDMDNHCPTNAAVILFAHRPKQFIPGAYVQYVKFGGTDKASEILNERVFTSCLFDQLPKLDTFTENSVVTTRPVPVTAFLEEQVVNYPREAIRELLLNAVMHRDYSSNMPIRYYEFSDRLEIMNAGGLYGKARPENFPHVNDYRNPIIAEALKNLGYVNMFNRSVSRVKELFKENGNPRLLRKPVKQGKEYSLYLEYQMGYNHDTGTSVRKKESLSLYVMASPRTVGERQKVKETIELAKKIRFEREQDFLENKEGYRLKKDKTLNFLDFYQAYIENYTKKDLRMVRIAYNRFVDFLKVYHPLMAEYIKPDAITHDMMLKFAGYLQTRSVGEGAKSILQRFKKVVRFCVSQGLMAKDPCEGVKCIVDDQVLKKDVLSQEEIQRLIDTHYPREKENVRNAFIFCLYTGMRFCDVKDLRYGSIDYANRLLSFEQDKTKGHSARSWVSIPLNDGLLTLVGKPEDSGKGKEDLIFDLPTYESCCKSVKRWVKRAGIDKHISWHCARHSFAVNILNNGANIKTVASLLGHSGLKHTEKYTRAVDKLKEDAINSLPELKL